ncbi:MAG: protein phosphatase 2C domain-containing protein [Deltaproteobacteria bacterium]|nr:protein phosphatase 2C domain-containing protein [Deltaproteobacteria bacterium]
MNIAFSARTDVGRVREQNEDNFLVDRKLQLYVVCDGMGGHQSGEVASATAVNVVRETLLEHRDLLDAYARMTGAIEDDDIRALLVQAVQHASNRIYERGMLNAEQRGMGTTCSLLLIVGMRGFIAHVGDSRVYRWRARQVELLTEDHSLYNAMVQSGANMGEMATVANLKNAVTRAVGVQQSVEVDTRVLRMEAGDRFLLCSDGLSGYLEDGDLERLFTRPTLDEITEQSLALANDRGGKDNITSIVVELPADYSVERATPTPAWDDALRRSWLTHDMSDRERALLVQRMTERSHAAGEVLCEAGAPADKLFFVLSGHLVLGSPTGATRDAGAGAVVGDLALLAGGTHPVRVAASSEGPATTLALGRETVERLMFEQPGLLARLLANMGRRISHRFIAAAEALGEPLWRYVDPGPVAVVARRDSAPPRIRTGSHTQELDAIDLVETDPMGIPPTPDAAPSLAGAPPPLPAAAAEVDDDEVGFGVAQADTLPQLSVSDLLGRSEDTDAMAAFEAAPTKRSEPKDR